MSAAEAARLFEAGQALHRLGKAGLAESHYLRVVKLDPRHADAWHLLGVIAFQAGHAAKATKHYRRALDVRPRFAQAWNNLALAFGAQGERAAARDAFRAALAIRPEYVEAGFNLALAESALGDDDAAEAAYRQVLAWAPDSLPALTNLGNLLRRRDRARDAIAPLRRAQQLAGDAATTVNLALALIDAGDYREATALSADATRRFPDDGHAWLALGSAARLDGDWDAAEHALARATALVPDDVAAWQEFAQVLETAGAHGRAQDAFARARALAPDDERLRWAAALSVPVLPDDDAAIDAAVASFRAGVAALAARPARDPMAALAAAASVTPFALHYLPRDTTAECAAFGDLVRATVARAWPAYAQPSTVLAVSPGERRLRVGFVSSHFREHTVARYFAAMIERLDPARFETTAIMTGEHGDATTARIAAAVARFVHHTGDLDALARSLHEAAFDVLVHVDVGMDPRQHVLAAARFAPVQLAMYGHPVTTGLPTIDAYLSAEALEPRDAARYYRERLVCLPGLGAAVAAPVVAVERGALDAARRDGGGLLFCPQHLAKFTPAFDDVLARVVAGSGARLVVVDRHRALTANWRARARRAFAGHGVDIDASVIALAPQPYPRFLGALADADVVLDTPWFSGGATSFDALAVGACVVTREATQARGRQTAAMLRRIEASALVARDDDDYVAIATRLAGDAAERATWRDRILAHAPRLFDADAVHAAFAATLERLAFAAATASTRDAG